MRVWISMSDCMSRYRYRGKWTKGSFDFKLGFVFACMLLRVFAMEMFALKARSDMVRH